MEERILRTIISKAGGTANGIAASYKISLPSKWAKQLGITPESREIKLAFDGETIIIKKA